MDSPVNDRLPPGESDIQAYVDGQLDARRRPLIEAYLAANPEEAARVKAYRVQNALLNDLFAGEMDRPLSGTLASLARRLSAKLERQRTIHRALAMAASVALVVGLGYAVLSDQERPAANGDRAAVAAVSQPSATFVGLNSRSRLGLPVEAEIETGDRAILTDWFAERVDRTPDPAPNLDGLGLSLIGGRVVSTADGPATQFLYRGDGGHPVVLFVATSETGAQTPYATITTIRDGQVSVHWRDGQHVYGLTGSVPLEVLLEIAQTVQDLLGQTPVFDQTPVLDQAFEQVVQDPLEPTQVVQDPLEPTDAQPSGVAPDTLETTDAQQSSVVLVESGDDAQSQAQPDAGQPPQVMQPPLVEEPALPDAAGDGAEDPKPL